MAEAEVAEDAAALVVLEIVELAEEEVLDEETAELLADDEVDEETGI